MIHIEYTEGEVVDFKVDGTLENDDLNLLYDKADREIVFSPLYAYKSYIDNAFGVELEGEIQNNIIHLLIMRYNHLNDNGSIVFGKWKLVKAYSSRRRALTESRNIRFEDFNFTTADSDISPIVVSLQIED